jgi:hypothetical protein
LEVAHRDKSFQQALKSYQWRWWSKWSRMRRQLTKKWRQNWSKYSKKMAQILVSLKTHLRSMMTQKVTRLEMTRVRLSMPHAKRTPRWKIRGRKISEEGSTMLWMFSSQLEFWKSKANSSNQIMKIQLSKESIHASKQEVN